MFFQDDSNLDSLKLKTLESGRQLVSIAIRRKFAEINNPVGYLMSNIESLKDYMSQFDIKTKLTANIPEVFGTKNQIEQVLMNILINAKHAINKDKGTITIETFANSEFVFLHITDTGFAMDDKTKQRLFDPFFTTKEVGVGTGLGLLISYKIIEAYRGLIEVESEINKGTCFKISLPIPE
ncbi:MULTISPECIES: sensor histidine kinase [unclassified Pseudoalteromonas]|uniref:sensor histidine kinase n=1 Tax=unclassified Pseudoalteromonas TaxID=194690 RepID=UPI0005A7F244|nr:MULTISPECIES: ATP-binding protein [unclassified Pseudoalteromonas]